MHKLFAFMLYNDFSLVMKYICQTVVTDIIWYFNFYKVHYLSTLTYEFWIWTWRGFRPYYVYAQISSIVWPILIYVRFVQFRALWKRQHSIHLIDFWRKATCQRNPSTLSVFAILTIKTLKFCRDSNTLKNRTQVI